MARASRHVGMIHWGRDRRHETAAVAAMAAAVATTAPTSWRCDILNRLLERPPPQRTIATCRLALAMYLNLHGSRKGRPRTR